LELQSLGDLNIFGADLTGEKDFDAPIAGCELVFQLATPLNFASEDPEVDCTTKKKLHYKFYNQMLLHAHVLKKKTNEKLVCNYYPE